MADYIPPLENLPIFDKVVFLTGDEFITIKQADKRYLRYPNAQGTENLQTTNINGVLTVNSTSNFKRNLLMNDTTLASNRTITSSFYNFYNSGSNGTLTQNGTLYNNAGAMYMQNTTNGGNINFVLNDTGGTQNFPLQLLSTGNVSNSAFTANSSTTLNGAVSIPNNDMFVRGIRIGYGTGNLDRNTVVGVGSGGSITTGNDNVFLGSFAGNQNTTANSNVLIGSFTGRYITTGSQNTFVGRDAGTQTTTGIRNTCIGRQAGYFNTGNENVFIGSDADATGNISNSVAIGYNVKATASNTIVIGLNTQTTYINGTLNIPGTITVPGTTNITGTATLSGATTLSGNISPTGNFITPIIFGSTLVSTSRLLNNVGTVSFLDNLNGATPTGTTTSSIYTDSTLVNGLAGMYYDCGINGGYHQFSTRDGSGNVSTPIYYGSALTSVSNTFVVRNSGTTSNRFDIAVDGSQNVNIRARSTSASTNAKININCDTVNAGGTTSNLAVLTINPTNLEMKRPIQFNYITKPGSLTQLGYIDTLIFEPITISSSTSVRKFGNFSVADQGTYNIEILFSLVGSASHNLSACTFGCDDTTETLSTVDIPTNYTTSLVGFNTISLSSTTTSYLKINFNINYASGSNTVYVNYLLSFSGGGTTTIDATGKITRIG